MRLVAHGLSRIGCGTSSFSLHLQKPPFNRNTMSIKDYRLTSSEEPSDEILQELMSQVAESARESSANAARVLRQKMEQTIALIRHNRQMAKV